MDMFAMIVFAIVVIAALIIDLKFVGGKHRAPTLKEALMWTVFFIAIGCSYGLFLYYEQSPQIASDYFAAYAIEKVLSVDNLFVFILIFSFFKVPEQYHHKVLFYGIIGAFILRAIFIIGGSELIAITYVNLFSTRINLILSLFGAVLIWKGIGAAREAMSDGDDEDEDFSKSAGARFVTWITGGKIINEYDGDKFFTYKQINVPENHQINWSKKELKSVKTVKYGTLLLVVVAVIEFTDLVFAVDSIPAIFSITQNKMVLYTSNIFAILGLRSMYFLLSNLLPLFRFLNYGLAVILAFIGTKMVIAPWFHIEGSTSLYIVLGILTFSIIISLLIPKNGKNIK